MHLKLVVAIGCFGWLMAADHGAAASLTGVVTAVGNRPIEDVLVIVLDGETGIPVSRPDAKPSTTGSILGFISTVTEADGSFRMDVPPGRYHVLAQQWEGAPLPWTNPVVFDDAQRYGPVVLPSGTARDVIVAPGGETSVTLSPRGTGHVVVEMEASNDDALLVISESPVGFDPVFQFAGWPGDFLTSAVAFNRPVKGEAEFYNLPAGKLYLGLFGNDNNPGYAAAEVEVADNQTTSVKLEWVAGWSDARKTPPAHLQSLYEKFQQHGWTYKDIAGLPAIGEAQKNPLRMREVLLTAKNRMVVLPDNTKASVLDVLTVSAYQRLNR